MRSCDWTAERAKEMLGILLALGPVRQRRYNPPAHGGPALPQRAGLPILCAHRIELHPRWRRGFPAQHILSRPQPPRY